MRRRPHPIREAARCRPSALRPRGEVAEWSNVPHSKCGVPGRVPWVRIPPSPPHTPDRLSLSSAPADNRRKTPAYSGPNRSRHCLKRPSPRCYRPHIRPQSPPGLGAVEFGLHLLSHFSTLCLDPCDRRPARHSEVCAQARSHFHVDNRGELGPKQARNSAVSGGHLGQSRCFNQPNRRCCSIQHVGMRVSIKRANDRLGGCRPSRIRCCRSGARKASLTNLRS